MQATRVPGSVANIQQMLNVGSRGASLLDSGHPRTKGRASAIGNGFVPEVSMRRFCAGICALLVLAGVVDSCHDASSPPGDRLASFALRIDFPTRETVAASQPVDRVHVIVSASDESVVKTLDVAFPPQLDSLPIRIEVPMASDVETFTVQVQLFAGSAPLYFGSQEVVAHRGENAAVVTMTVNYVGPVTVTVTGLGVGAGTIVSNPAGINCQIANVVTTGTCSATFPAGTSVAVSPNIVVFSGNYFASWAGACSGPTQPCIVPTSSPAATIVADFEFNPCAQAITMDVGATVSGALATTDCQFATGQVLDYYIFSLGSQQLLSASLTGTFSPELLFYSVDGPYWYSLAPAGAATATQVLALPAGTRYWLAPVNATANSLGSYRLTLAPLSSLSGCQSTRTTFGLSQFSATLGSDCAYTTIAGQSAVADPFSIYVPSGKVLHVTVASSAFPPLVEFRDGSNDQVLGAAIASSGNPTGAGTVSLSTVGGGPVRIWVTSASPNAPGGAYTITIDP